MKRRAIFAAAFSFLLLMTSCNFSQTSIESMIKPPTLSEEQQKIYQAVVSDVGSGKNIDLVYPRSGEYRSAYVIANLDSEPTDEALVFYRSNNSVSNAITINVLDQKDGDWYSVWETPEVDASEVEKLSFIQTEKETYIVIGFNLFNESDNSQQVKIYEYADGKLECSVSEACAAYEVYDINGNGEQEIVTIVNELDENGQKMTHARLYQYINGVFDITGEARMDSRTGEYSGIYMGNVDEDTPALYVDGVRGSEMYTEILAMQDNRFVNLTYDTYNGLYEESVRLTGLGCMDLTGNGIIEIPKNRPLPGYEDNQLYLIDWRRYVDGAYETDLTTYTDFTFDYRFTIPENWLNAVSAKKDAANNEVTFYIVQPDDPKDDTQKLLKIKTFTPDNLSGGELPSGYQMLSVNGQLVYGYSLYITGTEYDLDEDDVRDAFFHL